MKIIREAIEKDVYIVKYEKYERYESGGIKSRRFKASSKYNAFANVYCKHSYGGDLEEVKEDYPTEKEVLDAIESSNGDGCDYILYFANETTGEVYINENYEEFEDNDEDEEW